MDLDRLQDYLPKKQPSVIEKKKIELKLILEAKNEKTEIKSEMVMMNKIQKEQQQLLLEKQQKIDQLKRILQRKMEMSEWQSNKKGKNNDAIDELVANRLENLNERS